jgi:hypothetical protein
MPIQRSISWSVIAATVWVIIFTASCGSSSTQNRVLTSMSVTPASADASNFANGQVQFTATGTFTMPPSPAPVPFAAPYSGSWLSSDSNVATITQQGLAQCVSGASGSVTITGIASSNSAHGTQMSTAVRGTATLTCP